MVAQHGTPFNLRNIAPTIRDAGHAVSAGCFRLVNEQVAGLHDRVPVATRVIVQQ